MKKNKERYFVATRRGKQPKSRVEIEEAHDRVVERGIVQFRADRQLMEQLLQMAAYKRLPMGPMVRSWVVDRLRQESSALLNNPPVDLLVERRQFDYVADWLKQSGEMLKYYDRMLVDLTKYDSSTDRVKLMNELQPVIKAARDCLVQSQELTVHLEEKVNSNLERRSTIHTALAEVSELRKSLLKTLTTLTSHHSAE